jgi:hypothetical protein
MTLKCHHHPIRQARYWDFSRRDFKMKECVSFRQRLQQGTVAKQLCRCRHQQSWYKISPDAPQLPSTLITVVNIKRQIKPAPPSQASKRHQHHSMPSTTVSLSPGATVILSSTSLHHPHLLPPSCLGQSSPSEMPPSTRAMADRLEQRHGGPPSKRRMGPFAYDGEDDLHPCRRG